MKKISRFILGLLYVAFFVNIVIFIYHINLFRFISPYIKYIMIGFMVLFIIILVLGIKFLLFDMIKNRFNTKMIVFLYIIIIILNIALLLGNFGGNYLNKIVKKLTGTELYKSVIVVKNDSEINAIEDLENKKIGLINSQINNKDYTLCYEILEKNNLINQNEIIYYDSNLDLLSALYNSEVDAIGITINFVEAFKEYYEDLDKLKVIATNEMMVSVPKKTKQIDKPFTVLIIGSDQTKEGSYQADVLILMSINLQTKNVVMVDVVRDTYAINMATGKMDKITHTGWYGEENVVNIVSNLFDINIDYYVKFNFIGVTNLIDMIGGLNLNVPYTCLVDDNNRYIYPGYQKLNGYEVLALARTRKMQGSSLFTRGRMQMYIIEETIKQTSKDIILNNMVSFLDNIGNNIKLNIKEETLFEYIKKYIDIKNEITFKNYQLKGVDSSFYHESINAVLYTYKYDEQSLKELSNLLKENLKQK